jgi:threonine synthase
MVNSGLVNQNVISSVSIDEEQTQMTMIALAKLGYISEPHAAVAYKALQYQTQDSEFGVFLGTAHPAKFKDVVESTLGHPIGLPKELADCASETILSVNQNNSFSELKDYLLAGNPA